MWRTKTLERAWRRLGVGGGSDPDEGDRAADAEEDAAGSLDVLQDLVVAFTRTEQRRFSAALAAISGDPGPIDTPARLAAALDRWIRCLGGSGRPSVTRSPAGLYTPEYWRIRVDGADSATRNELERLCGRRLDA
jgi:hypothetical protein